MPKRVASMCLCLVAAGAGATFAGGRLETIDITGHIPSPADGQIRARVIGMKWDVRCIPVKYKVNVGSGVMSGAVVSATTVIVKVRAGSEPVIAGESPLPAGVRSPTE